MKQKKKDLIEGVDYHVSKDGYWIFTEKYHLERGFCCQNKCLHCPYTKDKNLKVKK